MNEDSSRRASATKFRYHPPNEAKTISSMTAIRHAVLGCLCASLGGCLLLVAPPPSDVAPTDAATDSQDGAAMIPDAPTPDADRGDVSWSDAFGNSIWPDAGSLAPPDWVPLTIAPVGACTPLSPCGGEIVGTWTSRADASSSTWTRCWRPVPGRCRHPPRGARSGTRGVRRRRLRTPRRGRRGRVDFYVPALCTSSSLVRNNPSASAALVTEANCTTGPSGDCTCVARQITHFDQADFYSTASNEIVSRSSGKRWAYCVAGDAMTYRDTSPTGAREPGTIVLRRR